MKNDCFTVCGEIAISVAPARSISGKMRFMASICPTQNGHQRPRMKQSTSASVGEEVRRRNYLAVVILQFELRSLRADRQNICRRVVALSVPR